MPIYSVRCGTCGHSRGAAEKVEIVQEHKDGKFQRTTFYNTWIFCGAPADLEFITPDGNVEIPAFGQTVEPRRPGCVIWVRRGTPNTKTP